MGFFEIQMCKICFKLLNFYLHTFYVEMFVRNHMNLCRSWTIQKFDVIFKNFTSLLYLSLINIFQIPTHLHAIIVIS